MAIPSLPRRGALAHRLILASVVWLSTVSLLLVLVPGGAAADGGGRTSAEWAGVAGAVRPAAHPEPADRTVGWAWPLAPLPRVVRPFDAPASPYGPGHRGIDLASAEGRPVRAVAPGVVTHSGMVAGRGTVTVRHSSGVESTYEPVESRVDEDSVVAAGTVLGSLSTAEHCASAEPCLHLGARLGEEYLDPLLLLTRVRIVLLPLPDVSG